MKFAHFADIHLGFQKEKSLQDIEQEVFERALDDCIRRSVDFILICGDMFQVNIPRMQVQKFAFAALRRVHEAGIPVYAIYGSHDFSPSATSVIDLLAETGYITRVQMLEEPEDEKGGAMSLGFVTDEKTGAKLAGISGLGTSKDMIYYENLDLDALEAEPG
ncbi:MAG: DNA repair exonuclease, partial [Desulfovibrionales bacterium]|nr:DNA repair exonuclease [Desulfovibrionales bacterium]